MSECTSMIVGRRVSIIISLLCKSPLLSVGNVKSRSVMGVVDDRRNHPRLETTMAPVVSRSLEAYSFNTVPEKLN